MIQEDSYAIVQKYGGAHLRLVQLKRDQKILIEKLRFEINGAFGGSYGVFDVFAGGKLKTSNLNSHNTGEHVSGSSGGPEMKTHDTRPIDADINMNSNFETQDSSETETKQSLPQKLCTSEINALKESGIGTSTLVSRLVDGNLSFGERSRFSQKKYVRKKTNKHSDKIIIMKPTIGLLIESYYKRDPERIGHLRIDLLALLLQLSGVRFGHKTFVYEQVLGVLGASIIERLSGQGCCVFLHHGQNPQSIPCINAMEFSEHQMDIFLPLPVKVLLEQNMGHTDIKNPSNGISDTVNKQNDGAGVNEAEADETSFSDDDNSTIYLKRKDRGREQKALEFLTPNSHQGNYGFDSICIAVRTTNPLEVLQLSFPSLQLSGTVVVYSSSRQHIVDSYQWLKINGAVNLQLFDQYCREYQVLPGSTHPIMQQQVTGGYVLSGIKVLQ